jgi:anti-sigma B factor antagonist
MLCNTIEKNWERRSNLEHLGAGPRQTGDPVVMRPLKTREEGGILILTLDEAASVNDGQSDVYRQAIYSTIEEIPRPRVAVDLGPIDFLSSSGVALLIGLRRRVAASEGTLVLYRLHPYVQDLLRMMKVMPLFRVAPDEEAALAVFQPSPTL